MNLKVNNAQDNAQMAESDCEREARGEEASNYSILARVLNI